MGTLVAGGASARAGGLANTLAAGTAKSSTITNQTTQPIVFETVLLRLTLRSGETIWAWDDTKWCGEEKPKCAVDDLIAVAGN